MAKTDQKTSDSHALQQAFKKLKVDTDSAGRCKGPSESLKSCPRCKGLKINHLSAANEQYLCDKNVVVPSHIAFVAESSRPKLIRDAKFKLSNPIKDRKITARTCYPRSNRIPAHFSHWPLNNPSMSSSKFLSADTGAVFGGASTLNSTTYADISQKFTSNVRRSHKRQPPLHPLLEAHVAEEPTISSQDDLSIPERSCSQEAYMESDDCSLADLAGYFDDCVHIPKKMSVMAEMMYL